MILTEKELNAVLDSLNEIPGHRGWAILGRDGSVLESRFEDRNGEDYVRALVDNIFSACHEELLEATTGKAISYILETNEGKLLLMSARTGMFLVVVLGGEDLNLGLARVTMEAVVSALE